MIKPIHLFWTGPIFAISGLFLLLGFWPYLEMHTSHVILGVLLFIALAIGVPVAVTLGTFSSNHWNDPLQKKISEED